MKPATGNCDTAEYFLKSSNGRRTKSAIVCNHRSIQLARRPRHQRVWHETPLATRDEHCQQMIANACRNHRERGIWADLRALLGGVTRATIVAFRVCSLYLT